MKLPMISYFQGRGDFVTHFLADVGNLGVNSALYLAGATTVAAVSVVALKALGITALGGVSLTAFPAAGALATVAVPPLLVGGALYLAHELVVDSVRRHM